MLFVGRVAATLTDLYGRQVDMWELDYGGTEFFETALQVVIRQIHPAKHYTVANKSCQIYLRVY